MVRRKTPPRIFRNLLPLWFLRWFDRHHATCWLRVYSWKQGYSLGESWWPQHTCWDGPLGEEYDYCGKYKTLADFKAGTFKPGQPCGDAELDGAKAWP